MENAINKLSRNGIRVTETPKTITLGPTQNVGIGVWGTIDYLVREHKFVCVRTTGAKKKRKRKRNGRKKGKTGSGSKPTR